MYTATGTLCRKDYVTQYAPLVKRLASHLFSRLPASVQLDDIVQAGMMGLMEAAERYRDDQGAQFETFAAQRIRGAMLDELRKNDWVPRGMRKAQRSIEVTLSRLEQKLGRAPAEQEVASELGIPLAQYQGLLQEAHGSQLLHFQDFDQDGENPFLDRHLVHEQADPQQLLLDKRFRKKLVKAIEKLPARENMLMGMYYEKELNFREIAEVLGVTESRVCQLHSQAVARLRTALREG